MKLLIVNETFSKIGGAEIRINLLIQKLKKIKFFEEIFLLSKESVSEKEVYSKTQELIKNHNIDIVQVHNAFKFTTEAVRAAKELNKKVVFFAHDYWGFCGRRNLITNKQKLCRCPSFLKCFSCIGLFSILHLLKLQQELNKCDAAIAPSNFVQMVYEKAGILKGKWQIMKPWIDLKAFKQNKKLKKDKKTLLFVGPLDYAKGAVLLAKAIRYLVQQIPYIKLKFIGGGQEIEGGNRKRIEKILEKDGTLSNVKFCGPKVKKELIKEYQKAALYICPPIWPEVFGQTWAQAMACGCPTITTNIPSLSDYFKNKKVMIKNNSPEQLAKKIIQILTQKGNPRLQNADFVKKNFDLNKNIRKLIKVYKALLD